MRDIHERILQVRREVGYIRKDVQVKVSASAAYPAVSHDAVTAAARDAMNKAGIVLRCEYDKERSDIHVERWKDERGYPRQQVFLDAMFVATFINADNPSDFLSLDVPAHALDSGDKAPGKAMSYAKKYALLHMFLLETGIDEESRSSEFDPTEIYSTIHAYLEAKDVDGLTSYWDTTLDNGQKNMIWRDFNTRQKADLRDLVAQGRLKKYGERKDEKDVDEKGKKVPTPAEGEDQVNVQKKEGSK